MKEANSRRNFSYELFIDFEEELENLLKPEPRNGDKRSKARAIHYNVDGTVNCEDLSHATLSQMVPNQELSQLKSFEISVASRNAGDNLSLFSYLFRSLTTLILDFSKITSLRVLGDEIPSLTKLSVNRCNLTDLDGVNYVPNLKILLAADNSITDVLPLTDLLKINTVDLEKNSIRNYNSISFLCLCTKLEHLILRGNPIASDNDYRSKIFSFIRQLLTLDADSQNRRKYCKSNSFDGKRDQDDNNDASTLLAISNDIKDDLVQKFINQKSVDEEEVTRAKEIQEPTQISSKEVEDNKTELIISTQKEDDSRGDNDTQGALQGFKTQRDEITYSEKELSSYDHTNEQLSFKLLYRRKSVEPIKLRGCNEIEDDSLWKTSDRPDSSNSSSASQLTDSGISESSSLKDYNIPRLPQLHHQGPNEFPAEDKELKRFKPLDMNVEKTEITFNTCSTSKIIRQDSQLNGKLIKDGDIEIEDYDDN